MSEVVKITIQEVDNPVSLEVSDSSESIVLTIGEVGYVGPQGPQGEKGDTGPVGDLDLFFEAYSRNILSYPASFNYSGDVLDSIVYTTSSGNINKLFSYTSGVLDTISLSGVLPSGVDLTKTFVYTSGNLTSYYYS